MDESTLLKKLTSEPGRGLEQLIQTYGPAVHKICRSILADLPPEEIEEAESDVFVNIWQHRDRIRTDNGCSLKSYLYAVARNVARDRLRAAKSAPLSLDRALENGIEPESGELTDDNVVREWLQDEVLTSLAELGEPEHGIFLERYYLGRSAKAIAKRRGLPQKKVENLLYRGKAKLRQILSKKGVTPYE
ncbi:MAG: sigma-70 family RNA polymerase sigma factor [Lachnospiraceae bacterium]|nr:sigma-70 family RNA polymerase sigma factor [Lachnospiraceae bacterium]